MRVCIVGAGFSGLVKAKTLTDFGHQCTVFDMAEEVGGVWSSRSRYAGVRTQNSKQTYCLSTLPMPAEYPTHPSGEQVQAYLESYVRINSLERHIKLETEVIAAEQSMNGWSVTTRSTDGKTALTSFDHLCVCSGTFNKPFIPSFLGADAFVAGGGRICHTSDLHNFSDVAGKKVIVVGYGKSACDSAQAIATAAASTTLIARRLFWKLPTLIGGLLHYSYLLLNRLGESLFEFIRPWKAQRLFASRLGAPLRNLAFMSLELATRIQCSLSSLDLVPPGPYSSIARSTISLVTPGFYESVKSGRIRVVRDAFIESLKVGSAHLSTGESVEVDVIVCGTGFVQKVPFLPEAIHQRLTDDKGNWKLYRRILPPGVANLTFNGFNSSLFCPLTSEVTSLWIAQYLAGDLSLLSTEEQQTHADDTLAWMEERAQGKHAHGTNLVPFSLSNTDEMMDDLGLSIGWLATVKQWLLPVDPAAYSGLGEVLRSRRRAWKKLE